MEITPRLLRMPEIIGDAKKGIPGIFPMPKSTFTEAVRTGRLPKPVKFGRASYWRAEEIQQAMDALRPAGEEEAAA